MYKIRVMHNNNLFLAYHPIYKTVCMISLRYHIDSVRKRGIVNRSRLISVSWHLKFAFYLPMQIMITKDRFFFYLKILILIHTCNLYEMQLYAIA